MLVIAIILTMIAGLAQSPLADIAPGLPMRDVIDDALLVLALVVALPRLGTSPLLASTFIFAWILCVVVAVLAVARVDTSDEIVIARQIAVPAVVIYLGLQLRSAEWDQVKRAGIVLGIVNACYMLVELSGFYIFDPAALVSGDSIGERITDGKPAYFYYWTGGSGLPPITRLGGLFLNPPIAGVATAAALVALFHTRDFKLHRTWMTVLTVVTILSFARAGWLIAVIGILIPVLVKRFGKFASVVLVVPVAWYAWAELGAQGNSASHSDGLASGVRIAFDSVFGVGLGTFGNYAHRVTFATEGGESLAGIALAGFGLIALVMLATLSVVLFLNLSSDADRWEAGLGLGIVIAALLSESAGALNGTTLAWLAVGVALRAAHERAKRSAVHSAQGGKAIYRNADT